MKHCSHCDIDVDNSYNLCPYCGQELMHLEHEKIHDTAYWQGEAAHQNCSVGFSWRTIPA